MYGSEKSSYATSLLLSDGTDPVASGTRAKHGGMKQ